MKLLPGRDTSASSHAQCSDTPLLMTPLDTGYDTEGGAVSDGMPFLGLVAGAGIAAAPEAWPAR